MTIETRVNRDAQIQSSRIIKFPFAWVSVFTWTACHLAREPMHHDKVEHAAWVQSVSGMAACRAVPFVSAD